MGSLVRWAVSIPAIAERAHHCPERWRLLRRRKQSKPNTEMDNQFHTRHPWYKATKARQYRTANNRLVYVQHSHSQGMTSSAQRRTYVSMAEPYRWELPYNEASIHFGSALEFACPAHCAHCIFAHRFELATIIASDRSDRCLKCNRLREIWI